MEFEYKNIKGVSSEAKFSDLKIIAEGPIELGNGWQADRVNYCKPLSIFIEFRSGPEKLPGHVPSEAVEVTKQYVQETYGVSI
jgi:hypothetical protein